MKNKLLLILGLAFLSIIIVVGYQTYSNRDIGFLKASYVPHTLQKNLSGYVDAIQLKGNTANTLQNGVEEKSKYKRTKNKIVIYFKKGEMVLKKQGGVYVDSKTKIEYGLSNN